MAGGEIDTDTEMTGATSFKDTTKKRGVRGSVDYVVKKVDRLINGEPVDMLPPSVRKATRTATVDDFRAQMHNTRDTEGRKLLRWRRKGEKLEPEFKNVYPKFESWWMAFAKRQMQLYPPETHRFGPGEKSPVYPQWLIARSFYEGGQVKVAKVRAAFNDPQFYNTTMMFIEQEATLKMHAIAVKKEFQRNFKAGGIISKNTVGTSFPDAEQLLASGLELEAVVMLIALVATATGVVGPLALLTPFFVGAGQVAVGMVGGAAIWELGKDGIKRLINSVDKNGDIAVFTKKCEESMREIRSQPAVMQHMIDVYGIDPTQITFNIKTGFPELGNGTTSNSWEAIQEDLNNDIKLREQFLTDLVKVDRKRAHALTEQFLTEDPHKRLLRSPTKSFIVNQTGARYEEEVLQMFEHLRTVGWPEKGIAPGLALDQANQLHLQMLYMESSRRVLATKASAKFAPILEDIAINTAIADGVEQKTKVVSNRRANLKRGTEGADGKVTGEGAMRTKQKEQAEKTKKRAQSLIDGAPAEGGNPAKDGLSQMEKSISPTESDGLFKRKEVVGSTFTDIASALRTQGFYTEAQAIEDENTFAAINAAETVVRVRKTTTETVTLLPYAKDGLLEQQAETDRLAAIPIILASALYATKGGGGEAARQAALQATDATKASRIASIEKTRDDITKQIQDLGDLLNTLKQKRQEAQSQFDTLSPLRPERIKIANTPEEMQAAYERVGTRPGAVAIIPDANLSNYGQTGNLMSDYVALPAFVAQRPPLGTLWAVAEDEKFENQKIILLAVAEAKAKEIYMANTGKDLYAAPTAVQTEIVGVRGGVAGAITKEQLITLPAHRVRELLDAQAGALPTYDALRPVDKLAQIKEIQDLETQRYVARQKALEVTKTAHNTVIAELVKAVEKVDETCDAQEETISLVEKFLEDRANVYREVRNMMRTESLQRYAVGALVQVNPNMTPNEKAAYCIAERQSNSPQGFLDFLRDIFKYHELGRGLDSASIAKMGPDKLYTVLINALGGPASAQRNIANMIVDSFQPTNPPGEGFRRFVIPPGFDVHTLPFINVMSILAYRNDPSLPPPLNALAIPHADTLTTQDMLSITENIASTIADRIAGSGAI